MANVSSLWVGEPLSTAHKVALRSFVHYGHSIKLYVYDMNLDVPLGVVKADANEIVPESDIFIHYGKLAPFADYFRYKMIAKTGEMWVDADTICLSQYFFEDKEYVFIEEMPNFYAQGILKMPSDSDLCIFLNEVASERKVQNREVLEEGRFDAKSWIFLGPGLLTEAVKKLSLEGYGQPALLVNGLDLSVSEESPVDLLWNPSNRNLMMERLSSSVSFTFFNSWLDFKGLSDKKSMLPEGSIMQEFQKIFFKDVI
jgi:hypothetical protein